MPFVSQRAALTLSEEEKTQLTNYATSRTRPKAVVERAQMLLGYAEGATISALARGLHTNRPRIERCVDKALQFGPLTALHDLPRPGRPRQITPEARAWLVAVACQKPKDLGLAAEQWTVAALAEYLRTHGHQEGHPSLAGIRKGTVSKLLAHHGLAPHTIRSSLVSTDPAFEEKMAQVLCCYKEVDLYRCGKKDDSMVAVLSYDEKPGIQAIRNLHPDRPPVPGTSPSWRRDPHYQRCGTVSLLASIDLLTGRVHGEVYDRHRSREFVAHLTSLDQHYPQEVTIKLILDNHSAHTSRETRAYLAQHPGRFQFIFTPTHASWLNLIEVFFSKMTRSFLRGIRVSSVEELKARIRQYLDEVNRMPTVFRWRWKMEEVNVA